MTCAACEPGYYQPGYSGAAGTNVAGDGETCQPCARSFYTYVGSRGRQAVYNSGAGMTFYDKTHGPESCVPRYQQLLIDAGQKFVIPDPNPGLTAPTAAACMALGKAASDAGKAAFVQFTYVAGQPTASAPSEDIVTNSCKVFVVDPANGATPANGVTPAGPKVPALLVKLIPSDPIAAASANKAKSMAGGLYARLDTALNIGKPITTVTTGEADCRKLCDMNSLCWGVRVTSAASCTLVTGEDELDVRSFYYNPAPGATLAARKW